MRTALSAEGKRVNRASRIFAAVVGVALAGAAVAEYRYRRGLERRYRQAVEARQQLELQFGEVLATHDRVKTELDNERQRSKEISDALVTMRGRLEEAVGHLTEEVRKAQELRARLSMMQSHMDQLQGELALALQRVEGSAPPGEAGAVQLERIVVSETGAAASSGRVVSINRDWNFVVIDLGWDAVRIGDTVSIFRGDQLLAKARVERVQEGICAATLLPEWQAAEIHVNDVVKIL